MLHHPKQNKVERSPLLGPPRGSTAYTSMMVGRQPVADSTHKQTSPLSVIEKSLELLGGSDGDESSLTAAINMKKVKVQSVDKRFQDHVTLYNSYVDQWEALVRVILQLRTIFEDHNPSRSLDGAVQHLHQLCKSSTSISISRPRPNCIEILYDGRDVPHDVIPALHAYNSAGRSVADLLDKGPPLRVALRHVIDSGKDLRRDILVASLGAEGPECLRNCEENIELLQETAIPAVAAIERKTLVILKRLEEFGNEQSTFDE